MNQMNNNSSTNTYQNRPMPQDITRNSNPQNTYPRYTCPPTPNILPNGMYQCRRCGLFISPTAERCVRCGEQVMKPNANNEAMDAWCFVSIILTSPLFLTNFWFIAVLVAFIWMIVFEVRYSKYKDNPYYNIKRLKQTRTALIIYLILCVVPVPFVILF